MQDPEKSQSNELQSELNKMNIGTYNSNAQSAELNARITEANTKIKEPKREAKWHNLLLIFIIITAGTIVYVNTFKNEFVWDDHIYIEENIPIKGFKYLPTFFYTPTHGNLYRPLRELDKAAVYNFFGLNVFGYHLNSLLLHLGISVLAYLIIFKLTSKKLLSFLSGLLFAVHPIHTERVANMTAGFDLIGALFLLLAILFYIIYSKNLKIRYLIYSGFAYILALLGAEEAAMFPLIILFYELIFGEKLKKTTLKAKQFFAACILITTIYFWIRFSIIKDIGRAAVYPGGNLFYTMLTMTKVFVKYILLLIFPFNLNLEHFVAVEKSLSITVIFSAILLILFLACTLWLTFNSENRSNNFKLTAFMSAFYFITLIPASNVVPLFTFMAERYLYVPSIAFCVLLALLLTKITRGSLLINILGGKSRTDKKNALIIGIILIAIIVLSYSIGTISRNSDWRTDLLLWSKTYEDNPSSSRVANNLGQAYMESGRLDESSFYISRAIELDQTNQFAFNNLGVFYAKTGNYTNAITAFIEAIKINADYYQAYENIGKAYIELGNYTKAEYALQKSLDINPNFYKSYNDLGTIAARSGDLGKAEEYFAEALRINPDYEEARTNLEKARLLK